MRLLATHGMHGGRDGRNQGRKEWVCVRTVSGLASSRVERVCAEGVRISVERVCAECVRISVERV